ncbi:MAG: hypothetical protein R6V83_10650 [Candidatus Thorarchaeota archaeon]
MAYAGSAAGAGAAAANRSSSYRVKFERKEFLQLVARAEPERIYQTGRMHFFAFDGFVMYTFECEDDDFRQRVFHAEEFSNRPWAERGGIW